MRKLIINVALSGIFVIAANIAGAANGNSAPTGMFFFGPHSQSHNLAGNALSNSLNESDTNADSDTDTTKTTGLSKNAKIAIGVGVGALAVGGIVAAIIAASGNGNDKPIADTNITIQNDTTQTQHMQYHAIKIDNQSSQAYNISAAFSPVAATATNYQELKICKLNADAQCNDAINQAANTCSATVQPGQSCLLWIHTVDGTAPIGTQTDNLQVTVTNTAVPAFNRQKTFQINYTRDLYAGGFFNYQYTGKEGMNAIARWNGTAWHALGNGLDGQLNVYDSMAIDNAGDLVVGGYFIHECSNAVCDTDGQLLNHIAKWDGKSWHPISNGFNDYVYSIAIGNNNDIYAGGYFTTDSGKVNVFNHIAKWDGTTWKGLIYGLNSYPNALKFDKTGNTLYVGGVFVWDDIGNPLNFVAKWDENQLYYFNWSPLQYGFDFSVSSLTFGATNNTLYASGEFTKACGNYACDTDNIALNHIAVWNGTSWSPLQHGLDNDPEHLAFDKKNNVLYAGGYFTYECGDEQCTSSVKSLYHIAKWDGQWSQVGNGLNDYVYAMTFDQNTGIVYAAGIFDADGGDNSLPDFMAKYDPSDSNATPGGWVDITNNFGSGNIKQFLIAPSIESIQEMP